MVQYTGRQGEIPRYCCIREMLDTGQPKCITFGGTAVDEAIRDELLRVVQPAAVESAIMASEVESHQQDVILEALQRDLEAARYCVQRAQKQYDLTDPENRLVAQELEQRWNAALQQVTDLETRMDRHIQSQSRRIRPSRDEFLKLASDLHSVWDSPSADVRLKKRIIRTLIHEIVADVDGQAGEVILVIHWKGGVHTELRLPRLRRGQNSCHTPKEIVEAVRVLAHACSDVVIAGALNRNRLPTGRGNRWTPQLVASLRSGHQIPCYTSGTEALKDWMNLTQAAQLLGISSTTLRLAVEQGEIEAAHPLADGPWIFSRTALETEAAQKLVKRAQRSLDAHKTSPDAGLRQLFNDIAR